MANYIGGDILEIVCSHPDIGDLKFSPKAGEDFTINMGGITTADDAQNVTGDGNMIQIMNNSLWSIEGPVSLDLTDKDSIVKFNKMASSPILANWTITHISGMIMRGKGKPVGERAFGTANAQQTLKISGPGILESIS